MGILADKWFGKAVRRTSIYVLWYCMCPIHWSVHGCGHILSRIGLYAIGVRGGCGSARWLVCVSLVVTMQGQSTSCRVGICSGCVVVTSGDGGRSAMNGVSMSKLGMCSVADTVVCCMWFPVSSVTGGCGGSVWIALPCCVVRPSWMAGVLSASWLRVVVVFADAFCGCTAHTGAAVSVW